MRDNFIVVKGRWEFHEFEGVMVNLYAPQSKEEKYRLWSELLIEKERLGGHWCMGGGF